MCCCSVVIVLFFVGFDFGGGGGGGWGEEYIIVYYFQNPLTQNIQICFPPRILSDITHISLFETTLTIFSLEWSGIRHNFYSTVRLK